MRSVRWKVHERVNESLKKCGKLREIFWCTRNSRFFFQSIFCLNRLNNQAKSRKNLFNRPSFPTENQSRKLRNYPQVKLFGHVFVFRASNKIKENPAGLGISYRIS